MAALVADYSSSDSESETEAESGTECGTIQPRTGSAMCEVKEPLTRESESEEETSDGSPQSKLMEEPQDASALLKLPPPQLEGAQGQLMAGVFTNPFARERRERLSLLEKHVRLTARIRTEEAGGQKICLAYRKDGRCRYGSNCKFAHDSDLPTYDPKTGIPNPPVEPRPQENGGSEDPQPKSGKKRPGLSPTLIPPKKSMKFYQAQRSKEGPGLL
ncbi:zinc finger CCCH domain-containing protein 15 [Scyliorhinus canicula]|uniref:zinc finger CCCH domain-containing protein 15 n=1 Tax=Scyliorhinus canicula TaxID=7830 RepID=UPI0018F2859C|nr:zinc finger CCCH domain-containing protein 15 [Scyliorhinus canicula]